MTATRRSDRCRLARASGLLVCVALLAGFSGCIVGPVGLTDSTKPLVPGSYTEIGPTTGQAFGVVILGFPISEPNLTGAARDRAIASKQADALVNVAIDSYIFPLGPVQISVTNVYGTAVKENK